MNQICIHCYVSGRVQGVFYRAHTHEKATVLGLTGWVRNLKDGRVELLACGPSESVKKLEEWLWEGSPGAAVENVLIEQQPYEHHSQFSVLE